MRLKLVIVMAVVVGAAACTGGAQPSSKPGASDGSVPPETLLLGTWFYRRLGVDVPAVRPSGVDMSVSRATVLTPWSVPNPTIVEASSRASSIVWLQPSDCRTQSWSTTGLSSSRRRSTAGPMRIHRTSPLRQPAVILLRPGDSPRHPGHHAGSHPG